MDWSKYTEDLTKEEHHIFLLHLSGGMQGIAEYHEENGESEIKLASIKRVFENARRGAKRHED